MASNTSRLMMLFLLVGISACAVIAIDGATNTDTNAGSNAARVAMPAILTNHASPLDTKAAASFAAKITDGTLNAKDFCAQANLLCDADIPFVDPSLDISLKSLLEGGNLLERARAVVEASQAMFFDAKDLVAGKDIVIPTIIRDEFPTTNFLPEELALKLMPFSGDRIAELLQKLNIPPTSNLAVMMSRTLNQCQAKAKAAKTTTKTMKEMTTKEEGSKPAADQCVTSIEGMSKFVAGRFPLDSRVDALERSIPASGSDAAAAKQQQKEGTSKFKVVDVKEYAHSVVCHKNVFPFAVYECHDMDIARTSLNKDDNRKVFAVAMEAREDGRKMNQIASCRAATAKNEGNANARKVIAPLPQPAACHWLSDAFVWGAAPKN